MAGTEEDESNTAEGDKFKPAEDGTDAKATAKEAKAAKKKEAMKKRRELRKQRRQERKQKWTALQALAAQRKQHLAETGKENAYGENEEETDDEADFAEMPEEMKVDPDK